ncbi:SHOCT domain-containing protein [Cellulomonas sp. KH9]|uniref:SHOCT domain-containing protein n=1 Tax=Cellulomonas sp. KH9 TaxID=1855324 RepID=UPI0008E6DD96|nr:SHOCT domain-containing protein [Cellulomonas sp. KH9]SFJ98606.1 Phospholipase_D-nuclease N-terminal [Cellulomonas sp. KH9]
MSSFWDFLWFIAVTYLFVAYLMALFWVISDVYRDRSTGGFVKALWTILLIFLPVLTLLIYLIANGSSMAERTAERARTTRESQETYIREVATTAPAARAATPVEQVAQAKALLDSGAISADEFQSMKTAALSGTTTAALS